MEAVLLGPCREGPSDLVAVPGEVGAGGMISVGTSAEVTGSDPAGAEGALPETSAGAVSRVASLAAARAADLARSPGVGGGVTFMSILS